MNQKPELDKNTLDNLNAYLNNVKCPYEAIKHMLSIGWTQEQIAQYWPDNIKNSAGVRFRAKPLVEEIEITDAGLDRIADDIFDKAFPFVREFNKFKHDVEWGEEKAKQNTLEDEKKLVMRLIESGFKSGRNIDSPVNDIQECNNNINGTKLQYDTDEFFKSLRELEAKQHAKEVAQAEKVEKYKRDLLNSREARFYKRFRELGATHDEAVKYAWGE